MPESLNRLSPDRNGNLWSIWNLVELFAVFCIGFTLINFFYTHPDVIPGGNVGVPGHDSGYHIKMAQLMPELGILDSFPWLQTTIFHKDRFVSHHWGFQAMMVPFIEVAEWRGFDAMTGGRWAIATFFGLVMLVFFLILQSEHVRFRWIWLGIFLALPHQFFGRMVFVRAIDLSLLCMLLLVFFIFRKRYVAAGITVAAFIHVYLGGLMYAPIIVVIFFICHWIAPRSQLNPWKLALWTFLGWCVGLRTHPYFEGAIEFLQVQVLGSGLTPDISVGREWASFNEVWWFAQMTGLSWGVLGLTLFLRLLSGRRINARLAALLLIQTVFLVLMCKSRRFVEYWPAFALLASALLVAPVLRRSVADPLDHNQQRTNPWLQWGLVVMLLLIAGAMFAVMTGVGQPGQGMFANLNIRFFWAEWHVWMYLACLYLLAPLGRAVTQAQPGQQKSWLPILIIPLSGALFAVGMVSLGYVATRNDSTELMSRIGFSRMYWLFLAVLYLLVPVAWLSLSLKLCEKKHAATGIMNSAIVLLTGTVFMLLLCTTVSVQLVHLQRSVKCGFDLEEVEAAMTWLKENTPKSSVVFTDDWDIFPIYFYYNHHNHYIVGLDPKFTHEVSPILWERYKKLSRGEFPERVTATWTDKLSREKQWVEIQVTVDDIVNYFNCDYVIVDRDHSRLARKLSKFPAKAERVWPDSDEERPAYQIFRMKRENIEKAFPARKRNPQS